MARKAKTLYPHLKFEVGLVLTEDLLATSPANEKVFREYVEAKQKARSEAGAVLTPADVDEGRTLPPLDEENPVSGFTVFHRDEKGLFVYDYLIKGFLKEAAANNADRFGLGWPPTVKKHMDNHVFIFPRRIYIMDKDGKPVTKQHGLLERPLRAETMRGPRTALAASQSVDAGCKLSFEIEVLPQTVFKDPDKLIPELLNYGRFKGLGQWRNGSYGRFTHTCKLTD